jgi:hypothetical protein
MNTAAILAKLKAYPLALALGGAAALMAALAYYRGGVLDDAVAQSADMDQQSKTIENNIIFGRDLADNLKQLRDEQKNLTAALIDPDSVIENQQYFFGFEHIDGLHILDPEQVSMLPRDKDATMSVVVFTMEASGNWEALTKFLYELETGPHLARVSKLMLAKFNQPGQASAPEQLSATLEVQVLGK